MLKTLAPITHVFSVSLSHPPAAQDSDPQLLRRVSPVGPVGPVCSVCSVGLNSHFARFVWSLFSVGGAARCSLSCRHVSILYASSDRYSGWATLVQLRFQVRSDNSSPGGRSEWRSDSLSAGHSGPRPIIDPKLPKLQRADPGSHSKDHLVTCLCTKRLATA